MAILIGYYPVCLYFISNSHLKSNSVAINTLLNKIFESYFLRKGNFQFKLCGNSNMISTNIVHKYCVFWECELYFSFFRMSGTFLVTAMFPNPNFFLSPSIFFVFLPQENFWRLLDHMKRRKLKMVSLNNEFASEFISYLPCGINKKLCLFNGGRFFLNI